MIRIYTAVLTVLLALGIAATGYAQDVDSYVGILEGVEARVNDEVITTSEVDEFLHKVEVELGRNFISQQEYETNRRRVLEKLVEESLLVQEAKKRGYQMDEADRNADVEKEWQARLANVGGPEAMQEALKEAGMNEEGLRQLIGEDIERGYLRDRMARSVLGPETWVTMEDIEQFRLKNPQQARSMETVRLSHILVAVPEDATGEVEQAARDKAYQILSRIRALGPDSFERFAKMYSDQEATRERGGSLGVVRRGELLKEFDIAFDMQTGDISEPIRTEQGYHILKVTDKRTIEELMRQQKSRDALEGLLKDLRKDAVITVKGAPAGD